MSKKDEGNGSISCVVVDPSDNKLKNGEKAGDATKVLGNTEQIANLEESMPSIDFNTVIYEVTIDDNGEICRKINGKREPINKTEKEAKKLIDEKGIQTTTTKKDKER